MKMHNENWFKYIAGFVICLLLRLIPFRPPNVEPILATQMPFSRIYGWFASFLFAFLSIVLFDLLVGKVGMWTFITAGTYGVLGVWASFFFKNRDNSRWAYAQFALIGTLFFDIVTGFSIGPLFFHQSLLEAFIGQIPFTAMHLLGNVGFAVILSPLIYSYILTNKKLEILPIVSINNPRRA